MALFTALAAAAAIGGLALGTVGMVQQQKGMKKASEAQAYAIAEQQKAEALRKQAMNLDASRRKREMVRNQVAAMGKAESIATNQGSQLGSALPGAYGGISGRTGVNVQGVNQNVELGQGIFDANAAASDQYRAAALAGGSAATGTGLASLGGMLLNNFQQIGQIGSWFAPAPARA